MNTKMKTRLLSLLLCLVLVVGLMPTTAMAAQQEISEVVATSQDLDSIPQLYGLLKIPEFTVTTGSPAYINSSASNLSWEKKVEGVWTNQYSGRFTPGEWRISTSLRIDGTENVINYKLNENGVMLTVNGQPWTVEAIHNSTYSFASVYSPVFTIVDDPNVQPPVPVESVHMVLNGYAPGAAAASATVTTDANVDVEVLGFLKAIDSNGDGQPDSLEEFTGNFASGEMYVVGLKIKAKSGYDISGLEFQNISLDRAVMTMPAEFDMNEECFLVTCILGDAMQYTVTFETNGGSAIQPVSVGGGGFVAEPTAPTRAYYAFEGWYSDSGLTQAFDFNQPITGDITLYAKWTPSPVNGMFLMTIDFNGGTSTMPSSVEVDANKEVYFEPAETIQSTVTPPSGKVFDAYEIDGVRYEYGGEYIVTQNFTLKLLWKDAAQQPTGHTHDYGQAPNNWDATHHWKECTDQACPDLAGSIKDKAPHSDSDGDGHCDACDVDLIKISFAPGEGTGTMAAVYVTLLPGSVSYDFTLPANGFTAPSGKSFKCWTVAGVEKAAGDNITVNANTTVTAIWENIPVVTYTVSFDANGGKVTPASATTGADGKLATLPTPTRSGYRFNGWYTAVIGGKEIKEDTVFTENTTVYAHWTKKPTGGSSGSGSTPAKKPVQSVDTGDMGIALYAGMALLSLTGGAWVVNKKRKGK